MLVEGEGFEPSKAEPSDLQSDPFGHSGTPPNETGYYGDFLHFCQTVGRHGSPTVRNSRAVLLSHPKAGLFWMRRGCCFATIEPAFAAIKFGGFF